MEWMVALVGNTRIKKRFNVFYTVLAKVHK